MAHWLRFSKAGKEYFGTLDGDRVTAWQGDMFAEPRPTSQSFALAEVRDQSLTPAEKRLKLDALTVERNALLKDAVQDSRAAQKAKDFTPADIARRGILK